MASRKHRHPEILKAFAEQYDFCEAQSWWTCEEWPWRLEIHHVMGGRNRIDAPWNLVRLCSGAHRWVTEHPIDGRILCWWILHQRGAFDCKAIHAATGIHPAGWIGSKQSEIRLPWVANLAGVLLGVSDHEASD